MSKEHTYTYEAGYIDGSTHYELEHCPACKNVADLQESLAENAKLREDMEDLESYDQILRDRLSQETELRVKSKAENDSLRELVSDMWQFTGAACKKYPRLFDPSAQGGQIVRPNMLDEFEYRMAELGIEVEQ